MSGRLEGKAFQAQLQRLEALLQAAQRFADPTARAQTQELMQAVLDLHAEGLRRILNYLEAAGAAGASVGAACAKDDVVGGLLMLHGLHPLDLETRVRQALNQVRPYLRSHGGNIELLGVDDEGVVRLRLEGSCHGCPSSALTMKQTVEEAIFARAPDVAAVEVEGSAEAPAVAPDGRMLISLPVLPVS